MWIVPANTLCDDHAVLQAIFGHKTVTTAIFKPVSLYDTGPPIRSHDHRKPKSDLEVAMASTVSFLYIFNIRQNSRIYWLHSPLGINLAAFVSIPICFFFVINNFYFYFFHTQHNRISKIKQNKTADTYSTSQGSIKREGDREGQQEHKSHSFK